MSGSVTCYGCGKHHADRHVMRCACGCIAFYSGARPLRRVDLARLVLEPPSPIDAGPAATPARGRLGRRGRGIDS